MNCRFCGRELSVEFIDLGNAPPSNSFLTLEQLNEPEVFFPLKLYVCDGCFLVQIDEYKRSDEIFSNDYVYFSSFSRTWLEHAEKYVEMMLRRFGYDGRSQVIEIASNDGYLLQFFQGRAIPCLGIEPAGGTAEEARKKGIETIVDFFGTALAEDLRARGRLADLVIGNNVLAHVPDINDFVEGLRIILKDDGVITMEFPHVMQLLAQNQFDTIYHEHFSYLSFTTVRKIFQRHGLDIFDAEELETHGGSLRIFGKHAEDVSKPESPAVAALIAREGALGMTGMDYYRGFQKRADGIKDDLLEFLIGAKRGGKTVAAYGAAAKGNTLLNYCGVRKDLISFVVDASTYKQGKFLPGSHIPVVGEDILKARMPDYVIILPWNIQREIMEQLAYIRQWGGRFVVPVPEVSVVP
ncbi:MAG: class I SAM-dependent methyltransferase [Syntrophorhabdus sp.]|nr:class I SAM-dependent methyltransferase [Syntrophorhabdus sp.]